MRILLISPYHGGSHRSWAEGYCHFSQHSVELLTLPARFWKWRMHGGSISLSRKYDELLLNKPEYRADLILATSMTDLTTFLALTRCETNNIPVILYMHENQLTYPLPGNGKNGPMRRQAGERDLHYAFINFVSMMSANHVFFNSHYHYDAFFDALPKFLKHFPDYNELESIASLRSKSEVLHVGIDLRRLKRHARTSNQVDPPLIIWNQRWEYDKNPSQFFKALYEIADEGISFQLALCGENYRQHPVEFEQAIERLKSHIVHIGYADEEEYHRLLWKASVTISTTHHEFFGISILEAIYCHTFPILPSRYSYPELVPERFHSFCMYRDQESLVNRLRHVLREPAEYAKITALLSENVKRFDWGVMAPKYDQTFTKVIQLSGNSGS